jgi:spermidine/putrescine transport system substrate-binding protein
MTHPHRGHVTGLTRRALLGAGAASAAAVVAGCGTGPKAGASSAPTDRSQQDGTLTVSNWALYIDTDGKGPDAHPTITGFEQETGIDVQYNEDITGNEEFFSKIRAQLAAGQGVGRDLVVLTDWMAARLIRMGYVMELDRSAMPNTANLIPSLQSPSFDPDRSYSMPWQSGFTALAYNSDVIDAPITSITEMLTRPDLAGRVAVFTEMRDTVGLVMLDQGADPSDFTDDQFDAAIALLQDAVDRNHIRQFADANYGQALAKGDLAASMTYSGDINQLQADNPELTLVVPDAGFLLWSDNMLIPVGALHKANAEQWIDYYYRPEVAAEVAAWVNFITPVDGAKQAMRSIDPALAANPLIFPAASDLAAGRIFRALSEEEETRYNEAFLAVQGV